MIDDIYTVIRQIVHEETKYLRHYIGKVVQIVNMVAGEVVVTIDALGWDTPEKGIIAYPRQMGLVMPQVGDYVEVYFVGGKTSYCVYVGLAQEFTGTKVKQQPDVIYESADTVSYIAKQGAIMTVEAQNIKIGANAVEPAILGEKLKLYLTNFINNVYNVHTHYVASAPGNTGVPNNSGTAPGDDIQSNKVTIE